MKHLLDLSVRTFCALWESAVEVSPATPWSWDQTKAALVASPRMGPGLVKEWETLTEADRATGLRLLAEYEPITPSGDVVQFRNTDGMRRFSESVVAKDVLVLNDTTLDVVGGPGGHSLRSLARDCGGLLMDSLLQANYAHVDVTAPRDILETGFDPAEAADLFSKVIRGEMAESDLRHERVGDARQFAGRLARFAKARRHLGGRDVLAWAAERDGVLSELGEGTITVRFTPKVTTAVDIDPGSILEVVGSSKYVKALNLRVTEANELAVMDAAQAARQFADHLERDRISMLTTIEENAVIVPVRDRTIAGVPDWLVEHAKSAGLMSVDTAAKLLLHEQRKPKTGRLLTEDDASVGPGGSAASASGDQGERGGVSHEQPDVKGGRTAQSQAEPAQEPQAPTEHVPDSEEGAPGGDVKLADGTIVPEPVMKDAMAKLLQNLATQLQQDTETDGEPKPPEGDGAEEEPEDPEAEQKAAEEQAKKDQEAAAASQATQKGAPQPSPAAAQTAVSGPEGTGKMAEAEYTSLAQRLLNGEITVAQAIGEKKQDDEDDKAARESSRASMEESGWMDDLQKIVPHVEAGLKAAGYKKDDDGYWCEKNGDDKIKLSPTPNGLLLIHQDPLSEQLDVGAGAEGEQAAQAVADAAEAMKALRGAVFALSTDHLVRIASMAAALGAKPAASEAESLRKEVEKLMDVTAELAKKLDKVNDRLKAKAGVDAGEIQAQQAVEPPPEPPPEEMAPPTEEPPPPQEPPPEEPPMTEHHKKYEKQIREALVRCSDTDIPVWVWEGVPYSQVRRAIMAECYDIGLSSDQVAEVRTRMRRMENVNVGRVFQIALTEGDRGLLTGVSIAEDDAPARVIRGAVESRGVSERTLAEAIDRLRQYGELEHKLLASALDKQMVAALAAVE